MFRTPKKSVVKFQYFSREFVATKIPGKVLEFYRTLLESSRMLLEVKFLSLCNRKWYFFKIIYEENLLSPINAEDCIFLSTFSNLIFSNKMNRKKYIMYSDRLKCFFFRFRYEKWINLSTTSLIWMILCKRKKNVKNLIFFIFRM